ncbi:fibulin-1-like isoform X2 [Ischnura elegans]|uniref:fibulin-1-like isoform X2 n=1 Tax=Ischnura elegans TaxID=197161 RepID=UPI001ED88FB6|nr:fibulin-1-like isoform X2 [Ischnura elegans]
MKYSSLFVGALILAVALPLCCGYYVVDGPQAELGERCNYTYECYYRYANCSWGICECETNYMEMEGICRPELGARCNGTDECYDRHATCRWGVCECEGNYTEKEGVCRPGLGERCNYTYECSDRYANCSWGICECETNYTEMEGICRPELGARCNGTDECYDRHATCRWGVCECEGNYTEKEGVCRPDFSGSNLGDDCNNDYQCGNNAECGGGGLCTCKTGFHAGDDLICVKGNASVGSSCINNVGCEKVPGLKCDQIYNRGECVCSDGFHINADGKTCAQGVESSCTPSSGCSDPAMECKESPDGVYTCQCRDGYEAVGDVCRKTGHSVHVHVDVDVDVDV